MFVPEFWVMGSLVMDESWSWPGGWEGNRWSWLLTTPQHHLTRFTSEFDLDMEGLVRGLDGPQTFALCNLVEPL